MSGSEKRSTVKQIKSSAPIRRRYSEVPAGAYCVHQRMRVENKQNCTHYWCPTCELEWDDPIEPSKA